ncbi:hypothetical protein BDV34DRAFT_204956 [Aspergillus parasiticus]|uniref:Uncharacterized protein n=1 Tax=Aspergillus parasiticus TaxID=5067 RepID=A0A5N6D5W4_ASPPA|nr:hypothetical protein BDV34DRAFT_204956 [Aspergillus parasiticus]
MISTHSPARFSSGVSVFPSGVKFFRALAVFDVTFRGSVYTEIWNMDGGYGASIMGRYTGSENGGFYSKGDGCRGKGTGNGPDCWF